MPGSSTLRLVLSLGADREPECRAEDGPSERLSRASGLARREAARPGWGQAMDMGRRGHIWAGFWRESRGPTDESDLEVQERGGSRAAARCPYPGALWELAKPPSPPADRCSTMNALPLSIQGGHDPQAPHSRPQEGGPQVSACASLDSQSVRSLWESKESPPALRRVWEPLGQ